MKVLSVVSSLDPTMGGTQSAATNILIATQRAGVEQVVATAGLAAGLERARGLVESLEREGIAVESFPNPRWPLGRSDRWSLSPPLARWIAGQLPMFDLVHAHGVWGGGPLSGLLATRLRGKPLVVTAHESLTRFYIYYSRSRARRRQKLWLKRAYLRWTTLFLLNSRLEVEDSLPTSERHRARAVHHPLVDESRPFHPRSHAAADATCWWDFWAGSTRRRT